MVRPFLTSIRIMLLVRKGKLWRRHTLPLGRAISHFGPSIRLFPALVRKPRLAALWVLSARRAQVALAVLTLGLLAAGPFVFAAIADTVFPPINTEDRVLVVLKLDRTFQHPSRDALNEGLAVSGWAAGLGYAFLLLVNHIPGAIRLGQRRGP